MRLPLVLDCDSDLIVAKTLLNAVSYMEPIDVKNGLYTIYDSDGYIIEAEVVKGGFLGERIVLTDRRSETPHVEELKGKIVDTLLYYRKKRGEQTAPDFFKDASMSRLIAELVAEGASVS